MAYSHGPDICNKILYLSFRQYCVHSLSVQLAHFSASFVCSQKRSGYIAQAISHTSHASADMMNRLRAKKLFMNSRGENIIK